MKEWKIDVPVLLIFFARPDTLEKVFESIREARPSTLLLWQDGPRENRPDDIENVEKCRKIVENIDWDCNVYKKYNEKNYGCDPSTFYAHKWAFSIVDKCIVMEDDFVAKQCFYTFCKELLDKYENDERINHICGMNVLGENKDCSYDYFFGYLGSNAWASWKRVVDGWKEDYAYLDDDYAINNLLKLDKVMKKRYAKWQRRRKTGIPFWESILCIDSLMNSRLVIIATKNMVENIGMTIDSTHSNTKTEYLTKAEKQLFNIPTYEIDFPIKHPPHVVADVAYFEKLNYFFGGPLHVRLYRKVYHFIKYLLYGQIFKKIKSKFKKV